MIAANSASSSSYDVRISALIGRVDRPHRAAHLDARSRPGSRASRTATSGRSAGIRAVASAAVAGLADHLDVVGALEQEAQPLADDVVVVEQVHADLVGVGHAPFLHHGDCAGASPRRCHGPWPG